MARPPVFNEPTDILDVLTEPDPPPLQPDRQTTQPGTNEHAPEEAERRPRGRQDAAEARRKSDEQTHPALDAKRSTAEQRKRLTTERRAIDARQHKANDTPSDPGRRPSPNVSLYFSAAQKRALMQLKIDLGMDYTAIVLDALAARHPQLRWGT